MENDIKTELENLLEIPVLTELETLTPPCVTVDIFLESPSLYGDGRAEVYAESVQLELWTLSNDHEKKEKLRQWVEENYMSPTIAYGKDPDTKLYRVIFNFERIRRQL